MSGETDYLLRIVVPDIAAYDRVYKRLIQSVDPGTTMRRR
jgi:Lrp/AsnC family transcriptional regulator